MASVMCLILFAYHIHPEFPLILAANRDEFYARPARPLSYWKDAPWVLAGRDLQGQGTWLGVTPRGKIAALTNYRDPAARMEGAPSRGLLVADFLNGVVTAESYLDAIAVEKDRYNGFNLIAGHAGRLLYYSNRGGKVREIAPGLYGLSNHLLDTPWPKLEKGKARFKDLITGGEKVTPEPIFNLLADRSRPPGGLLPDTGVGKKWERVLSSIFIVSRRYGTRNSSVIFIKHTGEVTFLERNFDLEGQAQTRTFKNSGSPTKGISKGKIA